jgi:hypothetical protein
VTALESRWRDSDNAPLVTVKVTEFDVPFVFVTETACAPGGVVIWAKGQGGLE